MLSPGPANFCAKLFKSVVARRRHFRPLATRDLCYAKRPSFGEGIRTNAREGGSWRSNGSVIRNSLIPIAAATSFIVRSERVPRHHRAHARRKFGKSKRLLEPSRPRRYRARGCVPRRSRNLREPRPAAPGFVCEGTAKSKCRRSPASRDRSSYSRFWGRGRKRRYERLRREYIEDYGCVIFSGRTRSSNSCAVR